ncbi:cytochrome oxidase small assembly protein [Undibacterium griseum]|nr:MULTISPECIES: cytochrome oxidase small assembly protein [Undibacterium]
MKNDKKPDNTRTALILASIALIFFIGVFVKQTLLR